MRDIVFARWNRSRVGVGGGSDEDTTNGGGCL